MKLLTAAQVRELDRLTIEEIGVPGIVLMENAGQAVVRAVEELLASMERRRVCLLAGRGNNGGDGFVVARHLYNRGVALETFLFGDREAVKGDARTNLLICEQLGLNIVPILSEAEIPQVREALARCEVVVDALLGTGISGAPREPLASAIRAVNDSGKPVVAVDVPSGLNSDTGEVVEGLCVRAQRTVTFAVLKIGLAVTPGAAYAGEVTVADIGIPRHLLEDEQFTVELTAPEAVRAWLPERPLDAHKGDCGRVVIFAGSEGMTGAAMLTARGAARAGAGLVYLGVPRSLNPIFEASLCEILTRPLAETPAHSLAAGAVEEAADLLAVADAVAVGPGLSQQEGTAEFLRALLPRLSCPVVLDADALNLLARNLELGQTATVPLVLTPHPGEIARLLQRSVAEVQRDRVGTAREAASAWNAVVVLKGARTVIAAPDGRVRVNPTGNPGLASGGSGDVLTGAIVSLLGQGLAPFEAAVAGVYLHGLAADLAAQRGMVGLLAGDVAEHLPTARQAVQKETEPPPT